MGRASRRSGMPRLLTRGAVVAALTLVGLATASATSCSACSCAAPLTPVEAAAAADAVFVGTFTGTRGSAVPGGVFSSSDLVAKRFEVSEVRKGEASAVTEVLTAASGASCGLEVVEGRTYVVVARASAQGLRADLCGGTREHVVASGELDLVGPAREPSGGERVAEVPLVGAGARDVLGSPLLWGPVAAASALVTLGLLALRRRRLAR